MTAYFTLAEAAAIARCSPKRLQNLMGRTLIEGVHFTRPRGRRPLFKRDAFLLWLEGRDDHLVTEWHVESPRTATRS
jgi:hypothetical protein